MSSPTALSLSNCVLSAIMSGILLFGGVANAFSLHFFLNQRPATTTSVIFRMISSVDLMTCFQASLVFRFQIHSQQIGQVNLSVQFRELDLINCSSLPAGFASADNILYQQIRCGIQLSLPLFHLGLPQQPHHAALHVPRGCPLHFSLPHSPQALVSRDPTCCDTPVARIRSGFGGWDLFSSTLVPSHKLHV